METLRPFFDGLEEGVIFLDRARRIVVINQAASRMIDRDYEAVIGEFCPRLFSGIECARACAARDDCSLVPTGTKQTRTLDLSLHRSDGSQVILRMWAIQLPEQERAAHYAIILRDRTRETLLEEETKERLRLGGMVGHSPAMQRLFQSIMQAAISTATVLIQGESGTGKELIAKALHDNSKRGNGPYVRVHCAAFPENLLEAELFGHAKGAFSGAHADRIGRFEAAHGGSILLDEIGEISPLTQVKLLRVLQEKEVTRLGENRPRKVDVRVITATNRDLAAMVRDGRFREDLYYRLNVLLIQAPPLRERPGDIPLLTHVLLSEMASRYGRDELRLADDTLARLEHHPWPGNVRELANVLEQAVVRSPGNLILPTHLPEGIFSTAPPPPLSGGGPPGLSPADTATTPTPKTAGYYRRPEGIAEKELIQQALREADGNKVAAARTLGMSRTTLWKRIREYGLER